MNKNDSRWLNIFLHKSKLFFSKNEQAFSIFFIYPGLISFNESPKTHQKPCPLLPLEIDFELNHQRF